jgi:hypothetical protein
MELNVTIIFLYCYNLEFQRCYNLEFLYYHSQEFLSRYCLQFLYCDERGVSCTAATWISSAATARNISTAAAYHS